MTNWFTSLYSLQKKTGAKITGKCRKAVPTVREQARLAVSFVVMRQQPGLFSIRPGCRAQIKASGPRWTARPLFSAAAAQSVAR